jgi:hypothetical protein
MAYKKDYTGLKAFIMILSFLATIYFSFSAVNHFIHWITSGLENHDIRLILIIVLWFFSFASVLAVSFALAAMLCFLLARWFGWD